jgi:hypothetical protein
MKNLKKEIFLNIPFRKCMYADCFTGGIYKTGEEKPNYPVLFYA